MHVNPFPQKKKKYPYSHYTTRPPWLPPHSASCTPMQPYALIIPSWETYAWRWPTNALSKW